MPHEVYNSYIWHFSHTTRELKYPQRHYVETRRPHESYFHLHKFCHIRDTNNAILFGILQHLNNYCNKFDNLRYCCYLQCINSTTLTCLKQQLGEISKLPKPTANRFLYLPTNHDTAYTQSQQAGTTATTLRPFKTAANR
jgi:hypothetical protein